MKIRCSTCRRACSSFVWVPAGAAIGLVVGDGDAGSGVGVVAPIAAGSLHAAAAIARATIATGARSLTPPSLRPGDGRGSGLGRRVEDHRRQWILLEVELLAQVAEDPHVLADRGPRVRPTHRSWVEPGAAQEQVLDELQVRVECMDLAVDR